MLQYWTLTTGQKRYYQYHNQAYHILACQFLPLAPMHLSFLVFAFRALALLVKLLLCDQEVDSNRENNLLQKYMIRLCIIDSCGTIFLEFHV